MCCADPALSGDLHHSKLGRYYNCAMQHRLSKVMNSLLKGLLFSLRHPHILTMATWQPPKREPAKTKAELREMLAAAVRNTQAENKRLQRAKSVKAA
jgi:hypothetical protein